MGIGVSYTGHGGKRRDFSLEGVPKPGEAADRLLGDTTSRVREALAMIPQHREKERGADGVKVHPRGSVKDSQEGICLKGEEFRPPKDDEIYSVVRGERGFHRLKDIDPAGQAARLGDTGVGGDSADSNKAGEDDAVMWQTVTRLAQETDNQGGLWLCQYERDVCKTKAGRVVSVSEERKTVVCELPQGGGDGGGDTPAGQTAPAPFDVVSVNGVQTIVRCSFYFDGELRTLNDYNAPASGTVYLAFTRTDPDAERGEPAAWSYQLTTTPAEPSEGASTVMNVKLYDFAAGAVTMDYRSAFLTVPAPDFDLYYGKYEFKKLQLAIPGSSERVEIGKIVASQDATIGQKMLVAGQNITLTEANGVITISALGEPVSAGPGITVSNGVVAANADGNTINIHSGSGNARTIQLRGAENPGACLIEEYRTLGERLARTENSDAMSSCYVPVLHNGVIKYIPFAELNIQVAAHSGFDVIRGSDTGGRPCLFVTWDGRSNPYGTYPDIALRTVNIYAADGTVASTVEVPASAAFKIPAVKGGNGITVTDESDGAVRRIDAAVADVTAAAGSGIIATKDPSTGVVSLTLANNDTTTYYTDTSNGLRLCVGATYNTSTHKFTAEYRRFKVQAGRLLANPTTETEEVFVAVEES